MVPTFISMAYLLPLLLWFKASFDVGCERLCFLLGNFFRLVYGQSHSIHRTYMVPYELKWFPSGTALLSITKPKEFICW